MWEYPKRIPWGYPFYGQEIGVLVFNSQSPRIVGDAGHAGTFAFPVQYEIVQGSFHQLVEGSAQSYNHLLNAVENLKKRGAKAVIGDCGLISLYQRKLARESGMLLAASSLCQLPMIWKIFGDTGEIGIITGHSAFLKESHLIESGMTEEMSLVIQGMEQEEHFSEIVLNGGKDLNISRMQGNVRDAAKKLLQRCCNLKAVILECSNLASFSQDVSEVTGVPVYDIVSTANWIAQGLHPQKFV